ncbi:transposase [Streptomyces sp. NBC_00342]|uniref:transposase n=1 Tax=Streptomyces sp. NBC_00342 TaxID=2975718 RepID=UPI002E2DA447|nr:transposase [Streptomyces sp. NBC_00342]
MAGTSPGAKAGVGRLCLQGILFVLYNDMAWQLLSLELGFGSGQTCWRCLDRWQRAGVFDRLHQVLLAELNAAGELDWSRACVDGSRIRAKKGAPIPVRRRSTGGKAGSKHHLICDGRGTPLKVITTAANVNDVMGFWSFRQIPWGRWHRAPGVRYLTCGFCGAGVLR